MLSAKAVSVPINSNNLNSVDLNNSLVNVPYKEAIGSLRFFALILRADINFAFDQFAINQINRYSNKHNKFYWLTVKRIFNYLKEFEIPNHLLYKSGRK